MKVQNKTFPELAHELNRGLFENDGSRFAAALARIVVAQRLTIDRQHLQMIADAVDEVRAASR